MNEQLLQLEPTYARIYVVVRQIPPGQVATYGQIAVIVGGCTARMVGYALAALNGGGDVPWQRVINAQGKISLRADSGDNARQRQLLEQEGVRFNQQGRVDFRQYRWPGPALGWLLENGFDPAPEWREQ
jgi:methylated-DNA-protein-cysteine methyltransferase-like protein